MRYEEVVTPLNQDYAQLWQFLSAGGFAAEGGGGQTVRQWLGRPPKLFADYAKDDLIAHS